MYPIEKKLKRVRLSYYLSGIKEIEAWVSAGKPNLEHQEYEMERMELLEDTRIGYTREQREQRIKKVHKIGLGISILGVILAVLIFFFYPNPWTIYAGLAFPLLTILYSKFQRHLLFLGIIERLKYNTVFWGNMACISSLDLLLITNYEIVDYSAFWPVFGYVNLALWALVFIGSSEFKQRGSNLLSVWMSILMFVFAYAYLLVMGLNCALEMTETEDHLGRVIKKSESGVKRSERTVTISPCGPEIDTAEVHVSKAIYNAAEPGDTLTIKLYKGNLGIPWVEVYE